VHGLGLQQNTEFGHRRTGGSVAAAVDHDPASGRLVQAGDHPHRGELPGAVRAEEPVTIPGWTRKLNPSTASFSPYRLLRFSTSIILFAFHFISGGKRGHSERAGYGRSLRPRARAGTWSSIVSRSSICLFQDVRKVVLVLRNDPRTFLLDHGSRWQSAASSALVGADGSPGLVAYSGRARPAGADSGRALGGPGRVLEG